MSGRWHGSRMLAWSARSCLGLTITILTFLEYDFMAGIGWDPVQGSDVPWPSGLALGPYGCLQVANFDHVGVCLIALAFGLHRGVRAARPYRSLCCF